MHDFLAGFLSSPTRLLCRVAGLFPSVFDVLTCTLDLLLRTLGAECYGNQRGEGEEKQCFFHIHSFSTSRARTVNLEVGSQTSRLPSPDTWRISCRSAEGLVTSLSLELYLPPGPEEISRCAARQNLYAHSPFYRLSSASPIRTRSSPWTSCLKRRLRVAGTQPGFINFDQIGECKFPRDGANCEQTRRRQIMVLRVLSVQHLDVESGVPKVASISRASRYLLWDKACEPRRLIESRNAHSSSSGCIGVGTTNASQLVPLRESQGRSKC